MSDKRTRAQKLAAMARAVESPHEAEIARLKLAAAIESAGRAPALPKNAKPAERGRLYVDGKEIATVGNVVLVFVDGTPEEAEVDDYGPFGD